MKKMSVVIAIFLGVTGLAQATPFPKLSPVPSDFGDYGTFAQSGSDGTESLYVKDLSGGWVPMLLGAAASSVGDDYLMSADIHFDADSGLGLVARGNVDTAYILMLNPTDNYFTLIRADGGTNFVNLDPELAGVDVQVGQTYKISLQVQGSDLTGKLYNSNGDLLQTVSATDSTYSTGAIGIFAMKQVNDLEGTWSNMSIVPEPFTLALLALGGLGLVRRRA